MNVKEIINVVMVKNIMLLSYNSKNVEICLLELVNMTPEVTKEKLRQCLLADKRLFAKILLALFECDKDYVIFETSNQLDFARQILKLSVYKRNDGSEFALCRMSEIVSRLMACDVEFDDEISNLLTEFFVLPFSTDDLLKKRALILSISESMNLKKAS